MVLSIKTANGVYNVSFEEDTFKEYLENAIAEKLKAFKYIRREFTLIYTFEDVELLSKILKHADFPDLELDVVYENNGKPLKVPKIYNSMSIEIKDSGTFFNINLYTTNYFEEGWYTGKSLDFAEFLDTLKFTTVGMSEGYTHSKEKYRREFIND